VSPSPALFLFALAVATITLVLGRSAARRWAAWKLRRRMARARRLEADAAELLVAAGYDVLDRQVAGVLPMRVDGAEQAAPLRADYIARRGRRRFVVEVKSGVRAPDPGDRATRRQLLEYAVAWRAHGTLLVNAEAGAVQEIEFPDLRTRGTATAVAAAFVLGTLVGAGLAAIWVESG
jgi:hypothetical protein